VEKRFVFVSFCVAASFAARKFLAVIPEKILQSIKNLQAEAEKSAERTEIVAEVLANKTAKDPHTLLTEGARSELEKKLGYDFNGVLVLRALLNPKFRKSRTTSGIAFDTGLTFPETLKFLNLMQENGDVIRAPNERPGKDSWRLTNQGGKKFEPFWKELRDLPWLDSGLE